MVDYQPSFFGDAREGLTRLQTFGRVGWLTLLCACLLYGVAARATVRSGDATHVYALEQNAAAMAELEQELIASIEETSADERFKLYCMYNQLMGTWLQVDWLEALLEASIATVLFSDEQSARTALRNQAQFAHADLDHAITDLERNAVAITRYDHVRLNEAIRALLAEVRTTVDRLMLDQCATATCSTTP